MYRSLWLISLFAILVLGGFFCTKGHVQPLDLERFDGGFFSIEKPNGWNIITAGNCGGFAFLIRDPSEPLKQVFYFGQVGPVYMVEQQKQIDYQYVNMGGYPVDWLDMPVVNPLTPGNFLSQFHLIAQSRIAQSFMPQCPRLSQVKIVSTQSQPCPMPGGTTELIRALFLEGGKLGEGLFLITVVPVLPFNGSPGGGLAYGFMMTGITAPKTEFENVQNTLLKSIKSFTVSQSYVSNCMSQQNSTYAGILKAGKTLSETSDIIMQGWESRNKVHDVLAEKGSDAILGRERLYDPSSGEVYDFENGFYGKYNLDRDRYEMSDLQLLPDDNHQLWMKAPLDGDKNLR